MATVSAVLELLPPGSKIVCFEDLYGGVIRLHNIISSKNGLTARYVDTTDTDNTIAAINERTKAVYRTPQQPDYACYKYTQNSSACTRKRSYPYNLQYLSLALLTELPCTRRRYSYPQRKQIPCGS